MGHEPDRHDWLGNTLRRSPGAAADACLDAETLAAWADGTLSAQASVAVETHASNCPRCMAVLAAMERTAPAVQARHDWTSARLFRWLAPLAAAATAIAIWVLVPNRPITSSVTLPAENSQARSASVDATSAAPTVPPQPPQSRTLNRNENQNPAPSTKNTEPQAQQEFQLRDESRERRANESMTPPAALAAPSAPPEAPAAPMASPGVASDSLAKAAPAQRLTLEESVATRESISATNPLNRWRVVSSAAIERSIDGGKTWMRTVPLPGVSPSRSAGQGILTVRAVDDLRALATIPDGTAFYTTDGGLSWTRVQENSPAPF